MGEPKTYVSFVHYFLSVVVDDSLMSLKKELILPVLLRFERMGVAAPGGGYLFLGLTEEEAQAQRKYVHT